ncbi:hypothetical protein AC622_12165 [Bacillus sp. FJAT-27916]|uniref:hypothetical protein n=1 Tax=Bacillaceae TaxID=186817 RepID=UPI00067171DF|nr:hypothetical protein [Bacillus sp. FJAT-27916]KMY44879.1 hypothetical protein AC622_12165 [Bacillus sp. FJAT-27916]
MNLEQRQQYPPINTQVFVNSANLSKEMISDLYTITNQVESNPTFARQLMEAAQRGQRNQVIALINSLPLTHRPEVTFSPGAIVVRILPANPSNSSANLTLTMIWKQSF